MRFPHLLLCVLSVYEFLSPPFELHVQFILIYLPYMNAEVLPCGLSSIIHLSFSVAYLYHDA